MLRVTYRSFEAHTIIAYGPPPERTYRPFLYACLGVYPTFPSDTFGNFDLFSGRQVAYVSPPRPVKSRLAIQAKRPRVTTRRVLPVGISLTLGDTIPKIIGHYCVVLFMAMRVRFLG